MLMVISYNDIVIVKLPLHRSDKDIIMNKTDREKPGVLIAIGEMYKKFRRDSVINDPDWLAPYSIEDIVDAVDEIALGELGKKVICNAARMAWGERRISFHTWERIVPDPLQEKLAQDFLKSYERFQQAKLKRAQIERLESLTGRANTISFPKKERLPRARLKKVDTA